MIWLLLITAVHLNNPNDIPARMSIEFNSLQSCEQAKDSVKYWIKFKQFKLEITCKESQ
jgi:hypothetical protein